MQFMVIKMNNKYKKLWDLLVLFFILYSCIHTSYLISFGIDNEDYPIIYYVAEVVFMVDLVLKFM